MTSTRSRHPVWTFGLPGLVLLLLGLSWAVSRRGGQTVDLMVEPQVGPFLVTVTAEGELRAKRSVEVVGPSGARQARIFELKVLRIVPEGTIVAKGDVVAELDKSAFQSRLQDVEIDLQKAESQFVQTQLDTSLTLSGARDAIVTLRYTMEEALLRKEQATFEAPSVRRQAEIDFERAERSLAQALKNYQTQVLQAEAQVREAQTGLLKAQREYDLLIELGAEFTVRAPENGMVIYKRDWSGQRLTAGGTVNAFDPVVATLPDLSVMESVTYINEVDIQKIREGQPVQVGLEAYPEKQISGTVTQVANIGEQRPRSDAKVFEVIIELAASDSSLRPAMTTRNTILMADIPQALYVPQECLHSADSLQYVFLDAGGDVLRQEVRLGLFNENEVIVEAGLEPEDRVYLSMPARPDEATLRRLPPDHTIDSARGLPDP